ncbi:bidirectional sugar transporter SWEET14-like [Aegilops tauschii subsp. strangulata]|uniref:Bidirectional sugar transporter SWEET n=1 Tax=Aegilops tauschii TaxID=37682 RepID=R7WCM6_AEGTA
MGGVSLQHPWAFAFGLLGNVISFMTYLAPLPTFYRIYRSKSTQGFQSVPYVVALFNAMLWIYYALLKSNECLLITINSAGCIIETIYIVIYLTYAPKQAKLFTAKILLLLNVGVFGLILLLTLLLSEGEKRVVMLGWVCVGFSVSVFIAPLSVILSTHPSYPMLVCIDPSNNSDKCIVPQSSQCLVVRTRSVEFMPFSLSLSLTISSVVWFLYGLLIKDKYVALPNILGFAFGVIQMGLCAVYRNATPTTAPKDVDDPMTNHGTTVKAPEHVVHIAKLGPVAGLELNTHYPVKPGMPPPMKENGKAHASVMTKGSVDKVDKATHIEQV